MSVKPTRRRNGSRMVTVRVEHHLSADNAATLLAKDLDFQDAVDNGVTDWNRNYILRAVRTELEYHGADALMDSADVEDFEEYEDIARDAIARYWPDWD